MPTAAFCSQALLIKQISDAWAAAGPAADRCLNDKHAMHVVEEALKEVLFDGLEFLPVGAGAAAAGVTGGTGVLGVTPFAVLADADAAASADAVAVCRRVL